MRFNYKPDRPLYAVLVRSFALPQTRWIPNRPSFAGCRSWVALNERDAVPAEGRPMMQDLEAIRERIAEALTP